MRFEIEFDEGEILEASELNTPITDIAMRAGFRVLRTMMSQVIDEKRAAESNLEDERQQYAYLHSAYSRLELELRSVKNELAQAGHSMKPNKLATEYERRLEQVYKAVHDGFETRQLISSQTCIPLNQIGHYLKKLYGQARISRFAKGKYTV